MLDHISLKPRGVISRRALLSILFVPVLMALGPAAGAHGAMKTFGYTGQQQTFVVPAGVSHLQVLAVGAHGAGFGEPARSSPARSPCPRARRSTSRSAARESSAILPPRRSTEAGSEA